MGAVWLCSTQSAISASILYVYMIANLKIRYSKTCLKRPLKTRLTKVLMANGSLMKVKNIAECLGAFCNTFDLH